jgi:hypothetical protein
MKRRLCLWILILSLWAVLSGQNAYIHDIEIQVPTSLSEFGIGCTPKQIFSSPDGGVIILFDCACTRYLSDEGTYLVRTDCGAIKLDSEGNCEWQWWSDDFDFGYWSIEGVDQQYQIIGINQDENGRVNFIIRKLQDFGITVCYEMGWIDPQGNYSLQNIPFLTGSPTLNRAMRLADGSIFAIGWIPVFHPELDDTLKHAYFLHLSAEGDTLSYHDYPPDVTPLALPNAQTYDMELDSDGMPVSTLYFGGYTSGVVKTDWDGNLIWRRDTTNGATNQPITKIPDTNELVFGNTIYLDDAGSSFILYRISETGIDSLFSIPIPDPNYLTRYFSIVGRNQGIYIAGNINHYYERIASYNLSGLSDWVSDFPYGWPYDQFTECLAVLPDSCIIHVAGTTVFKLTPEGTPNQDEVIPKPHLIIDSYPNPMKSSLNIDLKFERNKSKTAIPLEIYNIKGQLVKTISLDRKSNDIYSSVWNGTDLHGKSCANGTYILRIHINNDAASSKIVLIK